MAAVTHRQVHADELGRITRVEYDGRTHYSAAGRCVEWDGHEYHVTVTPPGVDVNCWTGYATEAEAREAITNWTPTWPTHARDMARARKSL